MNSGLETNSSDYVARAVLSPTSDFTLITKGRFNSTDFTPEAIDVIGTYNFHGLSGGVQYSRYAPQPLIGYPVSTRRRAAHAPATTSSIIISSMARPRWISIRTSTISRRGFMT